MDGGVGEVLSKEVAQASYAGVRWESTAGRKRREGNYFLVGTRLTPTEKASGTGAPETNDKLTL